VQMRRHSLAHHPAVGIGRVPLCPALSVLRVAPPLGAEGRVLGGVDGRRLGKDPGDLGIDRRGVPVGVGRCVGGELRAIDRDEAELAEPGRGTEPEDVGEEFAKGGLVVDPEAGDRRVVGELVGGDDPVGDVAVAASLDLARRALAGRVGVEEEGGHHRRLERRCPPAVGPVASVDRTEVHLGDGIEDEPGEIVIGQPIADRDRHQVLLVPLDRPEVVAHHCPPLPAPDPRIVAGRRCRRGVSATASPEGIGPLPMAVRRSLGLDSGVSSSFLANFGHELVGSVPRSGTTPPRRESGQVAWPAARHPLEISWLSTPHPRASPAPRARTPRLARTPHPALRPRLARASPHPTPRPRPVCPLAPRTRPPHAPISSTVARSRTDRVGCPGTKGGDVQ
jgi:hypothetical protein